MTRRAPRLAGGDEPCVVAMKSCVAISPDDDTGMTSLIKEAETLASLSHPNVVKLLAISLASSKRDLLCVKRSRNVAVISSLNADGNS